MCTQIEAWPIDVRGAKWKIAKPICIFVNAGTSPVDVVSADIHLRHTRHIPDRNPIGFPQELSVPHLGLQETQMARALQMETSNMYVHTKRNVAKGVRVWSRKSVSHQLSKPQHGFRNKSLMNHRVSFPVSPCRFPEQNINK